jgi:hypothetical protein
MFESRRLCLDHHYEALAPQREMEAKREREQRALFEKKNAERQEANLKREAEEERRKRLRSRLDLVHALILIAIPVAAFLYLSSQGVMRVLNMVLTGAIVGFLGLAAMTASSTSSYQGTVQGPSGYDADAFWIGLLGIPLGAAAGGILALVI